MRKQYIGVDPSPRVPVPSYYMAGQPVLLHGFTEHIPRTFHDHLRGSQATSPFDAVEFIINPCPPDHAQLFHIPLSKDHTAEETAKQAAEDAHAKQFSCPGVFSVFYTPSKTSSFFALATHVASLVALIPSAMPASICSWEKSPTLSNLFQDAHTYGVSPGRWCTFTYEKHNSSYETLALILSSDLLDHRLVTLLVPGCCARSPLFVSSTTGPECCFFPHCSEQHQDSQYQFELASCALPAYPPYGLRSGVIPYGFQAIMAHITSIGPAKRSAPLPALQAVLACLKDQYPHLHDIASSHHHQLLHSPNCHTTVTIRYGPYAGTVGQICGPNSRTREGYASVFLPCKPYPYSCHIPLGWIGTTVIPGDEVFYHDDDGMLIQGYVLKRNDAPQMTCDVADVTTGGVASIPIANLQPYCSTLGMSPFYASNER
ncbi:hypothetical protein FA13DRAFT_1795006 [Coprinellus micaceus]|uniref:Uncharacterized protein n=1 Tax=Coprinellus micaceus TaxID=71717 RepID=A0A4Y7SZC0_COPMI|nr:hypothetical protein FA13DRAFT_1795006 [Coprinellus micaceus]